jgi:hypothetical protein
MVTGEVNNMSADKLNKIEKDVKDCQIHIKKSNLILRQRIKDIQQEMVDWNFLGGIDDTKSNGNGNGFLHND